MFHLFSLDISFKNAFDQTFILFFVILLCVYFFSKQIHSFFINLTYKRNIKKVLSERQKLIQNFVEKYSQIVPQIEQDQILSWTASELVENIKQGKVTSESVLITYSMRAATVGKEYGLIADVNFDQALFEARMKDRQLKEAKEKEEKVPLLHGLPVSVKDHVTTIGLKYTAGFAKAANLPKAQHDCNFVRLLRENGAIPYVSSNLPQGIGSIESYNKIWGISLNPYNKLRTTGGSSGGEAGLIATKCSPLGIGSDAAGSIRIPCSFCGIYGYAPTGKRVSLKRTINLRKHDLNVWREITCSYGPMGKSVDDLVLVMKCLFGKFTKLDCDIPPLEWNETKYTSSCLRKMRIGVIYDDSFCESFPCVRNVISEVTSFLSKQGHEIIHITENWTEEFMMLGLPVMQSHGMASNLIKTLEGEPPESFYTLQVLLSYFPSFVLKFFGMMAPLVGETRLGKLLNVLYDRDLQQYYNAVEDKENLKDRYADFWASKNIDAMISPVLPFPAIRHGDADLVQGLVGSTFIYNIMGMPAGVVPIRKTREDEEFYNTRFNDMAARKLKSLAQGIKGLPVGVQVAAWSFEDETCLGLMKQIEKEFDYHEFPDV